MLQLQSSYTDLEHCAIHEQSLFNLVLGQWVKHLKFTNCMSQTAFAPFAPLGQLFSDWLQITNKI